MGNLIYFLEGLGVIILIILLAPRIYRPKISSVLEKTNLPKRESEKILLRASDYFTPAFRKLRSSKVTETINFLMARSIDRKVSKTLRKESRKRYESILLFDNFSMRRFVAKYITFVSLTNKVDVTNYIDYVISLYERLVASNGVAYALRTFKELYSIGCRFSTSNSFNPMSYRRVTAEGLPIIMGPLVAALKGTYDERRAALSVLQLIKVVEHHSSKFSTDTIVQKGLIKQLDFGEQPRVGNYFTRFIKEKGYKAGDVDLRRFRRLYVQVLSETFPLHLQSKRIEKISKLNSFQISARNGPSGPSLTTAAVDYLSFKTDESSNNLRLNILKFSELTNNEDLILLMNRFELEEVKAIHATGKVPFHSKISLKEESWGRLRPFAILDYFTQSSMTGLHEFLFRFLANQPEDGTFDQDRVSSIVQGWSSSGEKPESADLSAATDSIPVEIQAEIMAQIGGREFGRLWMNIVSNRDFLSPDGEYLRYGVGQPMGVLTSFAMLAIWHHITARTCILYDTLSISKTSPMYCIIGDDITMKGQSLFHIYETVVSKVMGIGISKTKGFHSETQTLDNPLIIDGVLPTSMTTAELAKRVFCNGREITPIPSTEILSALDSPLQFPELFHSLKSRGYSGYLNAKDIVRLSSLILQSKLGLTLAFSPLNDVPLEVSIDFDPKEHPIISKLAWFSPGYERYYFDIAFLQILESTHARFTNTLLGAFSTWYAKAQERDVVTAGWKYNSVTQSALLQSVVMKCAEKSEFSQNEFLMNYARDNSLVRLRRDIKLFQTIFEIGHVFVDIKRARALDRRLFSISYINIVLKQALKEMRNRAYYS